MAFYINASQYWRKERHWNQMGLHSFKAFIKPFEAPQRRVKTKT